MKIDKFFKNLYKEIKEKIIENIKNFDKTKNITYPITFFDDTTTGLDYKDTFKFKILNKSKDKIDAAKTEECKKYFQSKENLQLFINDENHIYAFKLESSDDFKLESLDDFKLESSDDFIILFDCIFYFDGNFIVCKYSSSILFKFKSNSLKDIYETTHIIYTLYDFIFNDKIDLSKFISFIKDKKYDEKLLDIIDYDSENLFNTLQEIKNLHKNNEVNGYQLIMFLLLGAKRFGDWFQVKLSKKYYFILQTNDHYCKFYSLLSGAPVIIDNIIYNYEISENLLDKNFTMFKLIKKEIDGKNKLICEEYKVPQNSKLLYRYISVIETPNTSRAYFLKYLKYKNKYLKLKDKF